LLISAEVLDEHLRQQLGDFVPDVFIGQGHTGSESSPC
jgi:hypothetical protein